MESPPGWSLWRRPAGVATLAVLAGTLLRVAAGAAMGLGIDESYEVANARCFQLSFFDHSPLSFWITTVTMRALGTDAALAVRLPFIVLFVATCWLMYRFAGRLFGAWAGAWSVVLLNVIPLFSIGAGAWVMPDGPMLLGVLASACCLLPVLAPAEGHSRKGTWLPWLAAGAWLGVAMLSKYLAVLYAVGVVAFVASTADRRRWLVHPAPYAGALLALVVLSPVLIWNARHGWISFVFQGQRAVPDALRPDRVLLSIGGQALYLLPWIWWPLVTEGWRALRAGTRTTGTWLCACLAGPGIILMTLVPLWGSKGLPHWTAVGYLFLVPLLGRAVAAQIDGPRRRLIRGWLRFSFIAFPLLLVVLVGHAATGWGRLVLPATLADEDPTHDTLSWRPLEELLVAHGLGGRDDVVVATVRWIDGAKAGEALGDRWPVTVFSDNPHNFSFLHDGESLVGRDVVFVGPPRRFERLEERFADSFDGFERLGRVALERRVGPEMELEAVLARRLRKPYPWPYP